MQILTIYLLIGTLFSAFTDYAHSVAKQNWPSEEAWEKSGLNNLDRLWLILLWPLGILLIIVRLFSKKS